MQTVRMSEKERKVSNYENETTKGMLVAANPDRRGPKVENGESENGA